MTNSPDISTTTTTAAATANAAGQSAGGATNNNNINNFTNGSSISESLAGSSSNEGHRTPNVEHLSKTNLYIRGLQSNTVDQDLYNMCSRFGQISSTKAILDKSSGCCKGYGFVEFTSPQTAELALQELTKSGVQAQMAKITSLYSSNHHHHHHQQHHHQQQQQHNHHHQHNQQQHQNQSQNSSSSNHSAVANITASSNGNGTTASSTSGNGNGNGTGVGNANGTGNSSGDGRGISSSASNSSNTQSHNQTPSHNNNADPTNLYIANLPPNMSEQELESLLSNYGPVVSTRILRDQSNIPRGVGFARMESRDKCEQIIEQLNGRPCKGWKEPLLVKFADGGNKKRHHHNNQHHNNNHHHHHHHHHQRHKAHQDDGRWRDASGTMDMGNVPSFDHQGNITHNEHLSDLSMMGTMGYQRMQHGFSPSVAHGAGYPTPLGPSTSGPQWIHSGAPGQAYVIPQQMIQNNALDPSNQAAAAAAAALHYGHIPQLASQMQGLQIAHPGGSVGGYLPPQHQWSALWTHPIPQQPHQQSMRLPAHMQPPPHPAPQQHRQQPSPHPTPVHQQQLTSPQPQPSLNDDKLQVSMPL